MAADEAQLVLDFFARAEAGFYVEVGAGGLSSACATLEAHGWGGVIVEPQPDVAAFMVSARRAQLFAVACASSDEAGEPVSLRVAAPGGTSYVVMVPTRTLDDILAESDAPAPLDLLAIDQNGREIEVLSGFDVAHWQPRLILLRDRIETLLTHRVMRSLGYRLVRRIGGIGWYVPGAAAVRATGTERWRIFREFYLGWPFRRLRNAWRRLRGR